MRERFNNTLAKERQILHGIAYMWNLQKQKIELIEKKTTMVISKAQEWGK